jgi:hypothetical protein
MTCVGPSAVPQYWNAKTFLRAREKSILWPKSLEPAGSLSADDTGWQSLPRPKSAGTDITRFPKDGRFDGASPFPWEPIISVEGNSTGFTFVLGCVSYGQPDRSYV